MDLIDVCCGQNKGSFLSTRYLFAIWRTFSAKKRRVQQPVALFNKKTKTTRALILALPICVFSSVQAEDADKFQYQDPDPMSAPTRTEIIKGEASKGDIGIGDSLQGKGQTYVSDSDSPVINALAYVTNIEPSVFFRVGIDGQRRIKNWLEFLVHNKNKAEPAKLEAVNHYFNNFEYIEDSVAWKKTDLWATPLEVLVRYGGDCEDLAIAKYFTLRALAVNTEKMRLTFVKNLLSQQSHMVLDYYPDKSAPLPLVLDNMQVKIGVRNDLRPIYSFNEETVWQGRKNNEGLGSSLQIERWRSLQERLHQQHVL